MGNFLLLILLVILSWGNVDNPHYPISKDAPICQSFGWNAHVGVDFNVKVGTPVYAILSGVVTSAMEDSRVYGRFVMILHDDGYASLYAHLSKLKVNKDDKIYSGEVIGLSGGDPNDKIDGDGWSTGAHLHFEIRVPGHLDNNLYNVNPMIYLDSYFNSCMTSIEKIPCR